jgi:hypothetical protein
MNSKIGSDGKSEQNAMSTHDSKGNLFSSASNSNYNSHINLHETIEMRNNQYGESQFCKDSNTEPVTLDVGSSPVFNKKAKVSEYAPSDTDSRHFVKNPNLTMNVNSKLGMQETYTSTNVQSLRGFDSKSDKG